MEFNTLQSAIELNKYEQPSVYTAICMIESLFLDIEMETGMPISMQPVGSEKLANKMLYLYRNLEQIYHSKKDQIVRNVDLLREKQDESRKLQEPLREAEAAAAEFPAVEAEYQARMARLTELRKIQGDCLQKKKLLNAAEKEIEELSQIDPAEIEKNLAAVQARLAELREQTSGLSRQLLESKEQAKEDAAKVVQLKKELEDLQKKKEILAQGQNEYIQRVREARDEFASLQGAVVQLQKTLEDETAKLENLKSEKTALQQKLQPLRDQIAEEKLKLQTVQSEKSNAEENLNALRQRQEDLSARISEIKRQIAEAEAQLENAKAELQNCETIKEEKEAEKHELEEKIRVCEEKLAKLRKETEELEKDYPRCEAMTGEEEKRREKLKNQCDELETQMNAASAEISAYSAKIPELENQRNQELVEVQRLKGVLEAGEKALTDVQIRKDALSSKLNDLTARITRMEDVEIPDLRTQILDGEMKANALTEQIEDEKKKKSDTTSRIGELQEKLPLIEAEWSALIQQHAKLTSVYQAKNAEIEKLKQQIDELSKQTGPEKLYLYQEQQCAKIQELKQMMQKCTDLEISIKAKEKDLEEKRNLYDKYQKKNEELKQMERDVDQLVHELRHVSTPEFDEKLTAYRNRLGQLSDIRQGLLDHIKMIQSALPAYAVPETAPKVADLQATMMQLASGLKGIQNTLLQCADNISLEERK